MLYLSVFLGIKFSWRNFSLQHASKIKGLLANFSRGLMMFMDRPFAVSERVRSPDREIEDTVVKIGWGLARIRTFDKRPLYVHHATFSTTAL